MVRRAGHAPALLGGGHHVLHFLDAGEHGAEGDELGLGQVGDQARQRRLAGARRSPQDDRLQQVAIDHLAQRPAGRDHIVLADDLVERARTHALGQRHGLGVDGRRRVVEQAHRLRCAAVVASYRMTAAATAAFSDSTAPLMGMLIARVGGRDHVVGQARAFAAQQHGRRSREVDVVASTRRRAARRPRSRRRRLASRSACRGDCGCG